MRKIKVTFRVENGPLMEQIVLANSAEEAKQLIKNQYYGKRILFSGISVSSS